MSVPPRAGVDAGADADAGAMARRARRLVGVMDVGGGHVTAALVAGGPVASGRVDGGPVASGRVDGAGVEGAGSDAGPEEARVQDRVDGTLDPGAGRAELLAALAAPARELARRSGVSELSWVVALPGPFDYAAGTGSFEGVGKFGSLAGIDLGAELGSALGAALDPAAGGVHFENDAVAYGVGDWAFGGLGRPDRAVVITLGTGVGSAFLDHGRAVSDGPTVPTDGNVHTLTIDGRPLEETMSSAAIVARYEVSSGAGTGAGVAAAGSLAAGAGSAGATSVEAICRAARAGDVVALSAVEGAVSALGAALAPWLDRFEASHLVVGGAISRSWDVIAEPLVAGLGRVDPALASRVVVLPSPLREDAPLLGAAECWWRDERD
ncbi:ROK family protein [Frigoribacterium sp. 2-23]|uniref:ROK family protein n=1 Tax=Frigoribacterium sp. 2-23 TaxID=3415006 RepID=UPI003C6F65EA